MKSSHLFITLLYVHSVFHLASGEPSAEPSKVPTVAPVTKSPTKAPTISPTTKSPTKNPTVSPTGKPTKSPTDSPSKAPTPIPTKQPSPNPSASTNNPTDKPTASPTLSPTSSPTKTPTKTPTQAPTLSSYLPTVSSAPSTLPSASPSSTPSSNPSTSMPSTTPSSSPTKNRCGCETCTDEIWNEKAGQFTCGERINWLRSPEGGSLSEEKACYKIAHDDFPEACGKCDSKHCDLEFPEYHFHCSCPGCNDDVWWKDADGVTCGKRIDWLQTFDGGEKSLLDACKRIGGREYPEICGACDPNTCHSDSGGKISTNLHWFSLTIGFAIFYYSLAF